MTTLSIIGSFYRAYMQRRKKSLEKGVSLDEIKHKMRTLQEKRILSIFPEKGGRDE